MLFLIILFIGLLHCFLLTRSFVRWINQINYDHPNHLGKGSGIKNWVQSVFYQTEGGEGGGHQYWKKQYCLFWRNQIQRACRIIFRPQKLVLHLAWSAFVLSTAIMKALKVAPKGPNPGKKKARKKEQIIIFLIGTMCKTCLTHK